MAKLVHALALVFAALVAIATAHKTTITTTKEDEDQAWSSRWECLRQFVDDQLNACPQHLWNIIQNPDVGYEFEKHLKEFVLCCKQLHNIEQQCMCDAMDQVFQDALRMLQGQEGGSFGAEQTRQLRQEAQKLPKQCNIQLSPQCKIANIRTVITTVIEEDRYSGQSSRGSQQCSEVQERQFNQCQRYIQQLQQEEGGSLLKSINRQGQHPQELKSCCNELENVQRECQCEAVQEVYEQAIRQQQQGMRQSDRRAGVQRAIQNLKNECNLQVHQCRVPSAMF